MTTNEMYQQLGISPEVLDFGQRVLDGLDEEMSRVDDIAEYNQAKVLSAMHKNRLNATHFNLSSGYGYDDEGRDNLERVYADVFHTEAALVRPQITCGTHALALALGANLLPGDELLSPVGAPYDTLEEVIGIRPSPGSLREYGVSYRQVDLLPDGSFDYDGIRAAIHEKTKLVTIQRSKGYATRPSFSVEEIGKLIAFCKNCKPDIICMAGTHRCGGRYGGGKPHQKSGRRSGSHRRLCLRPAGSHRSLRLPAQRTGPRQGGGRQSGSAHQFLSGAVSGSHSGGLLCKGRYLYSGML